MFSSRPSVLGLTLLLALAIPAGPAAAEPGDEASKASARALLKRGAKLYEARRMEAAAEAFKRAYMLWPRAKILINVAICYVELGRRLDAATWLRRALKTSADPVAMRKVLPRKLRKVLRVVGVVRVVIAGGTAAIALDGHGPAKASRAEWIVEPGRHVVTVRRPGAAALERRFDVPPGGQVFWRVAALPGKSRTDPAPASIPGAPKASRRKLRIGYFATVASIALASGVAMIATAAKTRDAHRAFKREQTRAHQRRGIRLMTATNALIGVTVSATAAAVTLAFFTDWSRLKRGGERAAAPRRAAPRVGVYASGRGGGLVVSGRF